MIFLKTIILKFEAFMSGLFKFIHLRYGLSIVIGLVFVPFLFLNGGCSKEKPEASFSLKNDTIVVGDTLYLTNLSSGASYYQWSFGDGGSSITKEPFHIYTKAGNYDITLVSINSAGTSTITKTIVVIFNTSIYEGTGVLDFSIGNNWATINNYFSGMDTMHFVDSTNGYFYHLVNYYNQGISFYFANNSNSEINASDLTFEIIVAYPFSGFTSKGISIGSSLEQVKTAYGVPGIFNGTNYTVYYYDALGIEFWTSVGSTIITEIAVYPPGYYPESSSKIKSTAGSSTFYHPQVRRIR